MQKRVNIKAIVSAVLFTVLTILFPVSCSIREGLDPCPRGLDLRFVFDYNMEYANAFPSKVDCYTLYIYDGQGKFLKSYSEMGDKLRDENYRLQVDLPLGKYQLVALGGTTCDKHSFSVVKNPENGGTRSDLQVKMQQKGMTSDQLLHDYFYGALDVEVGNDGFTYTPATIKMMRNTNNIRVLLQHLDGTAVPMDKFKFSIEDDNTLFDADNKLIPNGKVSYLPWAMGVTKPSRANDESEVSAGYAEFSTSRLWAENNNRLIVRRVEDDGVVMNIPLNEYLLMLKSERYNQMGGQEFLDRENDWSMIFFLDSRYKWINTQIIVNGWVVRLNEAEL